MRFTAREQATILAALRNWQSEDYYWYHQPQARLPMSIDHDDFFFEHEPLTIEQIDELCERINFDGTDQEPCDSGESFIATPASRKQG